MSSAPAVSCRRCGNPLMLQRPDRDVCLSCAALPDEPEAAQPEASDRADARQAVYEFATPFLTNGEAPEFGSVEWARLAQDDPRRETAIIRAALGWWRAGASADRYIRVLHAQYDRAVAALVEDQGRYARRDADDLAEADRLMAGDWSWWRPTSHVSYAELQRRRGGLPDGYREVTVEDAQQSWAQSDTKGNAA